MAPRDEAGDVRPLVERASPAFDDFYQRHYPDVVKLAYVMSGRWSVAEEVAQEAFLRAFDRWDGRLDRPEAWVRTVAANLARSRLRRVRAELRALSRLRARRDDRAEPPSEPPELTAFWAAVRALPARQAQAVALHYLEDRSVCEVSALMGCAEGTTKALLYQARKRLAAQLANRIAIERQP